MLISNRFSHTNVYLKRLTQFHLECWIEVYDPKVKTHMVVAEAKVLESPEAFLVDDIFVRLDFRRKGYGTLIVNSLQAIKNVLPVGITKTQEAQGFWTKLGLDDALGSDENKDIEKLLLENSQFDFKIIDSV